LLESITERRILTGRKPNTMINYYHHFGLSHQSSSESLFRKLEKIGRREIENPKQLFREQDFLLDNYLKLIGRSLALDMLVNGLGHRTSNSGQLEAIRRGGLMAFGIHSIILYGIPIALIAFYGLGMIWTFILVFLAKSYSSYWKLKREHYFHRPEL